MGLFNHLSKFAIALLSLLSIAFPLAAADSQSTAPQHTPGTIRLAVDATRVRQKIIHATLKFPVRPGPLTLYYPEWIPGDHAPDNPITDLAGLKFSAGGKTISWRRDGRNRLHPS